jgi:hypothetical protein
MEVRVKLHVSKVDDDDEEYYGSQEANNLWMSINYDHYPTINDIINRIKKNINSPTEMHLYMDNYWLPAWENSRILRDNDSIRVVMSQNNKDYKPIESPVKETRPKTELIKANNKQIGMEVNINGANEKSNTDKELISKSKPIEINDNRLIDNISKNIQAHGKNKWKNSKPNDLNKKPQHIIFKSSSSDSSSSDSSEEEEQEQEEGEEEEEDEYFDENTAVYSDQDSELKQVSVRKVFFLRFCGDESFFESLNHECLSFLLHSFIEDFLDLIFSYR